MAMGGGGRRTTKGIKWIYFYIIIIICRPPELREEGKFLSFVATQYKKTSTILSK
jgi:hypothetical protein